MFENVLEWKQHHLSIKVNLWGGILRVESTSQWKYGILCVGALDTVCHHYAFFCCVEMNLMIFRMNVDWWQHNNVSISAFSWGFPGFTYILFWDLFISFTASLNASTFISKVYSLDYFYECFCIRIEYVGIMSTLLSHKFSLLLLCNIWTIFLLSHSFCCWELLLKT